MKKIFVDNLPKTIQGNINWKDSVGKLVHFIYDDIEGDIEIIQYIKGSNPKLKIRYKNNEDYISITTFAQCRIGKIIGKITTKFRLSIGETFIDNKRDLVIIDREYRQKEQIDKKGRKSIKNEKWYKYHCNKDGYESWNTESNLLNGQGCACCRGLTVVEGINDITTTAPWMIPIIGLDVAKTHTAQSNKTVYPTCPNCGRKKNKLMKIVTIYKEHSIGCNCGDGVSKIAKFMFNTLEQLKEQKQINDFETEKVFDWCNFYNPFKGKDNSGRYDFAIEDLKLIIETDGGFHRKDNKMNNQSKEESIWIDNKKDELANKNHYNVIRISDEGEIKENILNSELNNIFDLSEIDWNECGEYAYSNLVKIACEYKKNNPDFTTTQIGEIMGYNRTTICKWLKIGNELGWCNYDSKGESTKNRKKIAKEHLVYLGKPIICLETKEVFISCSDCAKQSSKLFEIELKSGGISKVCRGERKQYLGFHFKYIEELTEEEYIKYDIENKLKELDKL